MACTEGSESMSAEELAAFPNTLVYVRERQAASAKTDVALQLDHDIAAFFNVGGPDWRSRINAALRVAMAKG